MKHEPLKRMVVSEDYEELSRDRSKAVRDTDIGPDEDDVV